MNHHIKYGNSIIEYSLAFAECKTLDIKINQDKLVHIIAHTDTNIGKIQKLHEY